MSKRVYNFYAGPAALPLEVLKTAQKELLNYNNSGMSIMELSHRSKTYDEVIETAKKNMKDLMGLDDSYHVLFLGGGASIQFAMVPYNFLAKAKVANYVDTGAWSTKAIKEAKKVGETHVLASSKEKDFSYIPKEFTIDENAAYLHITANNTIRGTEWFNFPETGNIPLVCDMSSDFLSRELDYTKFDLIYASAQKNVGPAGVTVVVIKNSLLEKTRDADLFTMLDYRTHVKKGSMFNTPPAFPIYIVGLVLKWLKANGELAEMEKMNIKKSKLLYDAIDNSNGFYIGTTAREDRSRMNVTFRLRDEKLEEELVKEAIEHDLIGLKGHRSVGGMRASIYNAVPYKGVEKLGDFLEKFRKNHA